MCGYVLAINCQNFTEIHSASVKILQKVLGGLLFLTHTVYIVCIECVCYECLLLYRIVFHPVLFVFDRVLSKKDTESHDR